MEYAVPNGGGSCLDSDQSNSDPDHDEQYRCSACGKNELDPRAFIEPQDRAGKLKLKAVAAATLGIATRSASAHTGWSEESEDKE